MEIDRKDAPSPQIILITSLHSVASESSLSSNSQRSTAVSLSRPVVLPLKMNSKVFLSQSHRTMLGSGLLAL